MTARKALDSAQLHAGRKLKADHAHELKQIAVAAKAGAVSCVMTCKSWEKQNDIADLLRTLGYKTELATAGGIYVYWGEG